VRTHDAPTGQLPGDTPLSRTLWPSPWRVELKQPAWCGFNQSWSDDTHSAFQPHPDGIGTLPVVA
jgi:hypothetical protein